ncbi:MAG: leucine-rich repeat protein, partial [Anaeroplasmataceae bacterium]
NLFFNCYNLEEVIFEENSILENISGSMFMNCYKLNNINLPKYIEGISPGIDNIGTFAFFNCKSLSQIFIPSSVRSIENEIFYNCENLKTVTVSNKTNFHDNWLSKCNATVIYY